MILHDTHYNMERLDHKKKLDARDQMYHASDIYYNISAMHR